MARINIEDELFKDIRFSDLCILEGSRKAALGSLVELWLTAQKFVRPDNPDAIFSHKEFVKNRLSDALTKAGFATIEDGQVKVAGARENFAWLVKLQVAGKKGGEASGESRRNDSDGLEGSQGQARVKPGSSLPNPLTPSLTLTPILSPPLSQPSGKRRKKPASETDDNRKIRQAFADAYRQRYGIEPVTNTQVHSQVDNLRKKLGVEEAILLVQFYLKHNESFYIRNTHTFGHCLRDAETLRTQMLKGKAITTVMVKQHERTEATRNTQERIAKEGI